MDLPTKILIIGTIRKGDTVLLRKKFEGSKPYAETWYSFGCEFVAGEFPEETFVKYIKNYLNIEIAFERKLFWDTEIKDDFDSARKQFVYLELEFNYVSGGVVIPDGLEKVEFVDIDNLSKIDLVPSSVKLFQRIGYLK